MSTFHITKPALGKENRAGTYASAASRGVALGGHASDGAAFALAGNGNFIGFLTKDVTVAGPLMLDSLLPLGRTDLEMPFKAGGMVSLEDGEEVEAGGSTYIDGSISGSSNIGDAVNFTSGKFAAAGASEPILFILTAKLANDDDGDAVYRFQRV
jgi:hypothetical protein